jgi:hypothetical protein
MLLEGHGVQGPVVLVHAKRGSQGVHDVAPEVRDTIPKGQGVQAFANKSKYVPEGQGAVPRLSSLVIAAGAREMFARERPARSWSPVASAAPNEEALSSVSRLSALELFVVVTTKLTLSEPCIRRRRADAIAVVMRTLSFVER